MLQRLPHTALHNIGLHLEKNDATAFGRAHARFEPEEYVISYKQNLPDEDDFDAKYDAAIETLTLWMNDRIGYRNKVIVKDCYIYHEGERYSLQDDVIKLIVKHWPSIQDLEFIMDNQQKQEIFMELFKLKNLKTLAVHNITFELPGMGAWPRLQTLDLEGTLFLYSPAMIRISDLRLQNVILTNVKFDSNDDFMELIMSLLSSATITTIRVSSMHNMDLNIQQTQDIEKAIKPYQHLITSYISPDMSAPLHAQWQLHDNPFWLSDD